ncbi:MAG: hypothetical protein AB1896_18285 [Thermodesulfobacteriota bacterium]
MTATNPKPENNRREILITFIISGGIVLAFFLAALYPQYRALKREGARILSLKAEIEQQKLLHPLYQELAARARFEPAPELPFPQKEKLARGEVGRLSDIFAAAAREAGLIFDSVIPQVNSLGQGTDFLMADLTVRGSFSSLRKFLTALGGMPYFEHLERLRVERTGSLDLIEMRIWLALE